MSSLSTSHLFVISNIPIRDEFSDNLRQKIEPRLVDRKADAVPLRQHANLI